MLLVIIAGSSYSFYENRKNTEAADKVNTVKSRTAQNNAEVTQENVTAGTKKYKGFLLDNVLHSKEDGDIHYNVYIPDDYDGSKAYALFMTLPGYQGLYFQGVGENIKTGDGKTLVVYYSATGSTKGVAEEIADQTNGDLFEIQPVEPYTDDDLDWTDDDSRVSKEHDNEDERDVALVSTTVDNWDSYDTVFIGYPIWWGIAAWPVDNFVKDNDFTGKTVIPFCTSASSGIGDSGNLLKKMAGTGEWQDGERFRSGASESDVDSWVESLGLAK